MNCLSDMIRFANNLFILVITVLSAFVFPFSYSFADVHVVYENESNNSLKIELFAKKGAILIVNRDKTFKVVDFDKHEMFFFNRDKSNNVLKLPIVNVNEEKPVDQVDRDGLLGAKIVDTKEKAFVGGKEANVLKFTSQIDEEQTVYGIRIGDDDLIQTLVSGLAKIQSNGNEVLKTASFYYALKAGYLPIGIKTKRDVWMATEVENKPLSKKLFDKPKRMKVISDKEYLEDIAKSILDGMQ